MGLPCRLLVASAGLAGALDAAATRARRVDAIVAAFVADAAAMPLHWIYDTDDLAAILARERRAETPEFLPESHAPYYAYPPGEQTPFGEQMLVYLRALADSGGAFDAAATADAYAAYYGPAARAARPFESYVDTATREFLANYAAGRRYPRVGGEDAETNAVAHVLPVAAARAGFDDFLESCEAAIRVVQDNDDAVAFGLAFARILEAVILGSTVDDAVRDVRETLARGTGNRNDAFFARGLAKMDAWRARPPFDVTLELGQACDFPFHAFTAPHMLLHNMSSLVAAVRETIVIGGENANRGSFVASILAAAGGEVPDAWLEKTARGAEVRALAARAVDGGAAAPAAPPPREALAPDLGNAPGCVGHANRSSWNGTAPASHPDDVAALRALYLATGGGGWTRNACWLNESIPVCWWDQVACEGGRVQQLRLASNNLVGALDEASLAGLAGLEVLQLGFNPRLGGPLPKSAAALPRLKHVYAWNASLTGVGGLPPSLTQLDLADNALAAPLPDAAAALANATFVDVAGNDAACSPAVAAWVRSREFGFGC